MGVDLRMEPYATMFGEDRPGLRILDEFCFPDISAASRDEVGRLLR